MPRRQVLFVASILVCTRPEQLLHSGRTAMTHTLKDVGLSLCIMFGLPVCYVCTVSQLPSWGN